MKINILSIILLFVLCSNTFGETTEGIKFFHGSWEEAKTKAKEENKIVFIDFYTQWCGPCLNMVKKVFILPDVASFYNNNFVCLKIDAETEEGKVIAKQYVVQSYPTYVFVNPKNEKSVHRSGGRKSAEDFIAVGKAALNPQLTSEYIISEYNSGNRGQVFMLSYVRYMASIYKKEAVVDAFNQIIKNGGKLSDPAIWELFNDCITGYDNPYLKEISDYYSKYVDLFGREAIDSKLAKETSYCVADFMAQLCDFEGKDFNIRLKRISDNIYREKDYSKAIESIDALIADTTLNKQKVIDRLKFMVRLNKRYGAEYTDEWFNKSVEYLRYIAYNNADRDEVRIHFDYAVALEMMLERTAKNDKKIPKFLNSEPEYGKKEYSSRPAELKMKPKHKKK